MAEAEKSIAAQIVDMILQAVDLYTMELWNSDDDTPYLTIRMPDGHSEHYSLKTMKTKQYLGCLFHNNTGNMASGSALTDAITILSGYAQKEEQHQLFIRVGKDDDAIYIDLGDRSWEAIKITADGWQIIKSPPIHFRRPRGMMALPRPIRGGSIDDLRPLLNTDDNSWPLMKAWLLSLLRSVGPYPILVINGEQGSAKSYSQKILKAVIDPSILEMRRPAENQEDLMIAAHNSWVVSFDNMSQVSPNLSDDLCNISTGGGIAKRALYSDTEESIIRVCRPIILNGIDDFITRPDLLDRSIPISLPKIENRNRKAEEALLAQFEHLHPSILGALLDMAVIAMQKFNSIKLDKPGRMAGFMKWAVAGLGSDSKAFLSAYESARTDASRNVFEGDPLITQLKAFMVTKGTWTGSATDLLTLLNAQANFDIIPKEWPKATNALSSRLKRLAPVLENEGINLSEYSRDPTTNVRRWKIDTKR